MADTPTIIDCADIATEATRLRALFTPCYSLTALDLDDLVNLAYSASLCGTTTGLDQDNIVVLKYAGQAAGDTLDQAAAAINAMASFSILEKEIAIIRVTRFTTSNADIVLTHDFYMLKDVGKGAYGVGGTLLDGTNLFFVRSTEGYSLPNVGNPIVYTIATTDISEPPEDSLNAYSNGAGYVIAPGSDYYFEILEQSVGYTGPYSLYRWVGADGHYGADGVDTAVNSDFVLVETNDGEAPGSSLQNNKLTTIFTNTATQAGESAAVVAINSTAAFTVSDIENIIFRVPRQKSTVNKGLDNLWYDYYLFLNLGKGTYGLANTAISISNLLLFKTTQVYGLETIEDVPPVVYELRTNDISNNPQDVLNIFTNGTGFLVQNNEDAYFEIKETLENLTDSGDIPTFTGGFKLYRFVGTAGNYGADGVDTSILADFVLVEINDEGVALGVNKRVIDTVEIINGANVVSDNISLAVNRGYWGDLTIDVNDLVTFRALRKVTNTNSSFSLLEEHYLYNKAAGVINGDSTIKDFTLGSSKLIIAPQTDIKGIQNKMYGVTSTLITTPEEGVNNSTSGYTIDSANYDTYFISNSNGIGGEDYKIFKFIGADGTYGTGGINTAVFGDFTEVTKYSEDVTTPFATSQVYNDGEDGANPFITAADIPTVPDAPTGLELITEGGNNGWRLIGRDPLNYGDIGEGATDLSYSSGVSSTMGSTGNYNLTVGKNLENAFNESILVGSGIVTNNVSGGYVSGNVIASDGSLIVHGSMSSSLIGIFDGTIGTTAIGVNDGSFYASLAIGWGITAPTGRGTGLIGQALTISAADCTVVGTSNLDVTTDAVNNYWITRPNNPRFIVGVGTVDTTNITGTVDRKNGFVVWGDGSVFAPELTPALIDAKGNTSLITKEYGDINYLASTIFVDNTFQVENLTDDTKILDFDVSNVSPGFTRTIIMADEDIDLADVPNLVVRVDALDNKSNIYTSNTMLTASQIKNIGTTPIELAAAPGVGFMLSVINATIMVNTGGTLPYDSNTLQISLTGTDPQFVSSTSFLNIITPGHRYMIETGDDNTKVENLALIVKGVDSVATGDVTLNVYVTYEIISL